MAAGDLTTLANAKLWLGITQSTDDAQLSRLVTAASDFITSYCNRSILSAAYVGEKYNGNGNKALVVRQWPIVSVQSLSINGLAVAASDLTFEDRVIYLNGSQILVVGQANVLVSYTAGYAVVPPAIEQACIDLVALKYRERDRIGHVSKSLAGETVTFLMSDMHPNTRTLLNEFTNKVPA